MRYVEQECEAWIKTMIWICQIVAELQDAVFEPHLEDSQVFIVIKQRLHSDK